VDVLVFATGFDIKAPLGQFDITEFLAFVGDNGKTLSGLCRAGVQMQEQLQPGKAPA
jgi:hypothetical protein